MNHSIDTGDGFTRLAYLATADLDFDAESTLRGVRDRNRRRTLRRRRMLVGAPVAGVLAVGVLLAQALNPTSLPPAAAYEFGTNDAPVLAELPAGLTVSYLPEEIEGPLVPFSHSDAADLGGGLVILETDCYVADPYDEDSAKIGICVSVAPDLDVNEYLKYNWFVGEPTEVNGKPALINAITSDGAGGILFSPEPGTVVEIHLIESLSSDLRSIVAGMDVGRG